MLIHATITISGESTALAACEDRLRRRLSAQYVEEEVTEHHGGRALCYDLKVEGGIPFPLFAEVSQEFPTLTFNAEWVNVEAGERGSATIVNGRVTAHQSDRIPVAAADEHPVYVSIAEDGSLRLALTMLRAGSGKWLAYAVTATGDALLRIERAPRAEELALYATDGSPEWTFAWRGTLASQFARDDLNPPVAIDGDAFSELDLLARNFAAGWIWFASAPAEEIAIEMERHARRGYAVSAANVRSARLHRMQAVTGEAGVPLEYSTFPAEDEWIADLVLATWAEEQG